MREQQNRPTRFFVHLWLTLATFMIFVVAFVAYVHSEKRLDQANASRFRSFQLAHELRQSSDDLTRMVRTYVVTGNPIYKRHYQEILDIRNGKVPRPLEYSSVYWDLVLADDQRPTLSGQATPLVDLMQEAHFSQAELAQLIKAKTHSDALTATEYKAMALVEGRTPTPQAMRDQAVLMLHDSAYHQAKSAIMTPIRDFERMVDARTQTAVRTAEDQANLTRWLLVVVGLTLVMLVWKTRRALYAILGTSVDNLYATIDLLGRGEFAAPIALDPEDSSTVLSRLADTQRRLAKLDAARHLAEARLIEARDAAQAANRGKSTFLANMSHELRTPMSAIIGMTNLVLRHNTDPKVEDQLTKISQASKHLLAVINNILDISKIEADHMQLEEADFQLGSVLENVTSLIGHRAAEKSLALMIDLPVDLSRLPLNGDPFRLGQILLNLAGNAIKYTSHGSVTLRARLIEDNPSDVLLRFESIDTGIGITQEAQQRLFTAFEQADTSMTRKYGGTGLGLAISKRLASLMDGSIGVDSQPGQGSTFWFTARLRKSTTPLPTAPTANEKSAELLIRRDYGGLCVLLAEDEPINREVSTAMLETAGLVVEQADDGAQAVEKARQKRYAIILMDMQMPHINGIDATKLIRNDSLNRDTPILAMTANAFNEDRQLCLAAGMNDHIGKPVNPDKLYLTLLKCLPKQGI